MEFQWRRNNGLMEHFGIRTCQSATQTASQNIESNIWCVCVLRKAWLIQLSWQNLPFRTRCSAEWLGETGGWPCGSKKRQLPWRCVLATLASDDGWNEARMLRITADSKYRRYEELTGTLHIVAFAFAPYHRPFFYFPLTLTPLQVCRLSNRCW